jgi:hypothetical protein
MGGGWSSAKLRAAGGNRTLDLLLTKEPLYRLSHRGAGAGETIPLKAFPALVGLGTIIRNVRGRGPRGLPDSE